MLISRVGQWLNLVERCFRVAEAESSNLSCPTNLKTPGIFRCPRGLLLGGCRGRVTSVYCPHAPLGILATDADGLADGLRRPARPGQHAEAIGPGPRDALVRKQNRQRTVGLALDHGQDGSVQRQAGVP